MLVRFHRSLRTTTLPEVGRVHQKEKEVFHSADIKVRDNHQLRVNWVQVALIVEMTKKGAGSAQLVVLKGGWVRGGEGGGGAGTYQTDLVLTCLCRQRKPLLSLIPAVRAPLFH